MIVPRFGSAVFLLLLPLAAAAEERRFTDTTTVVAVEVPVRVVADGKSVRGLTAESFELYDGDRRVAPTGFEVIDLEAVGGAGLREVPAAARRHFLLLFDLSFSRAKALERSVAGARQLLAGLHGTDRVAVGVFGLASGVRLIVNFTSDRGQIAQVLDVIGRLLDRKLKAKDLRTVRARPADPLRLIASDLSGVAAEIGRAAGVEQTLAGQTLADIGSTGGLGGFLQSNILYHMDQQMSQDLRERRRSEVTALAGGLAAVGRLTRGIAGEKLLVYFSEGFENQLLDADGAASFLRELNRTFEELRHDGWSVVSVNPSGAEDFATRDGLALFARETGGELYENFNDLGDAMENLLERTEVTYLLTFQTGEIPHDGAFHPLTVRLTGGPSGAEVRHRAGYYAPRQAAEADAVEAAFASADLLLSGKEGGALGLGTLVVPFRAAAGEGCDAAVWIEADGRELLNERAAGVLRTELFVYAVDAAGEIRDFFTRQLDFDIAKVRDRLSRGSLRFYGDLRLTVGRYDLRVLLRDTDSGRYALRGVPLEVAADPGTGVVLLDPVFLADPDDPSVVLREREDAAGESRYPFMVGEWAYFPKVRPAMAVLRGARISLMAYHLDPRSLLSAAVLRGDGSPVEPERLAVVGKDVRGELAQILFDFRSAGLEPGSYTFQVALQDPASAVTLTRSLAFRVESAPQ